MLTFSTFAFGQRLLIQYDYLKDDFKYYKVSKSVSVWVTIVVRASFVKEMFNALCRE